MLTEPIARELPFIDVVAEHDTMGVERSEFLQRPDAYLLVPSVVTERSWDHFPEHDFFARQAARRFARTALATQINRTSMDS
jgi:hypothetical protein